MKTSLYKKLFLVTVLLLLPFSTKAQSANDLEKIFYMAPGKNGLESLRKNINKIDIVAPQSYSIQANLTATGTISDDIKNVVRINNKKIMPLLVNEGFKQSVIHNLLKSGQAQEQVINYLVREAQANGYIGWQFDFEHIYYKDRDLYSSFVERTADVLKSNNLIFSVAAIARVDDKMNDGYKNWGGVFDYKRLAAAADFISLMTYDDPNSEGPTASIPYIENVFKYLKDKIPPAKLSLGIPFYYWGWSMEPVKKVRSGGTYDLLQKVKANYPYYEGFNDILKVPFLVYLDNKKNYIIWHEDERSFKEKLEFAKSHNLRGFSGWVLGLENPKIWDVL